MGRGAKGAWERGLIMQVQSEQPRVLQDEGCLVGDDRQIKDYEILVALKGRHRLLGGKCHQC